MKLFTIGYEGADLSDFIAALKASGIKQVIDVREVPLSRKRGFSKRVLAETLNKKRIRYLHIKALGDPKPGREAARRGDFATFRKIYSRHFGSHEARTALQAASQAAVENVSCLLCFERSFENCHRSIIAAELEKTMNFKVEHLLVKKAFAVKAGAINDGHVGRELSLG